MFAILSKFFRFSLQSLNESAEGFSSFRCTFINTGILQNPDEYFSDLFFQDLIDVVLVEIGIFRKEFFHPVRM